MRLDLGAGNKQNEGYLRADISAAFRPDVVCDARRLPFKDGALEEIRADHLLEHVPAGQDRIDIFNECHRSLEDGGLFRSEVPLFPFWVAMADPTHVSMWVTQSYDYFDGEGQYQEHMALYGIKPWKNLRRERSDNGQVLRCEMTKVAA
jgi:predicted SAM-dependent methyltransferase